MVELALSFVLLVMLLVGTVTSAISYGRHNSLQNAAREASRYAATLPGPVNGGWLTTVRDVARAAATGDLDASVSGSFICVAHTDGNSTQAFRDPGGSSTTPCFTDGRPAGEVRVQVVVERDTTIDAVIFSTDVTLHAEAAARYER